MMRTQMAILLFDGVDLMDVAGPYEVLLTAARLQRRAGMAPTFEVYTVAARAEPVEVYGGLRVLADRRVADVEAVDVVIIPGAIAINELERDIDVMTAVRELVGKSRLATSVCTGAFLLERAGALTGRTVTTHWEDSTALARRTGVGKVRDDVRWVDDGDVITAGGLSSGIAMALHLVERLASHDLAAATARQLDYVWSEGR